MDCCNIRGDELQHKKIENTLTTLEERCELERFGKVFHFKSINLKPRAKSQVDSATYCCSFCVFNKAQSK